MNRKDFPSSAWKPNSHRVTISRAAENLPAEIRRSLEPIPTFRLLSVLILVQVSEPGCHRSISESEEESIGLQFMRIMLLLQIPARRYESNTIRLFHSNSTDS